MVPPPRLPEEVVQALAQLLDEGPDTLASGLDALCARWPDVADAIRAEAAALADVADGRDTIATGDPSARPQHHFGPYRVLAEIGSGGMGTVYLAEQKTPVRRRVALKVIKLGMDTRAVLARFEAERQALALMDHSSIARVYDAGTTPEGRPYFAMEYVKGVAITRYCDDQRLPLEDRLALFRQVCAGVQHAHQKGVIHRDLTPNNVLVTVQDGRPMAKIIDFGLARATDHRLTEKTVFTELGVILGTPEYMSPEQAGLDALDVDMRSDVYTLGVLLYELLTGVLPFPREQLRSAGYERMCAIIRTQDPDKPSTRITRQARDSEVARLRRTDSYRLLRRLRGDLDWVVLKCLEKDRTRRYETVSELAADVQRHLDDEPVQARAPTLRYRLGKVARRYRGQLMAAAAVLVALVVGLVGMTIFWLESREQAQRALAKAEEARKQTELAQAEKQAAESARARETARAKEAVENAATALQNASLYAAKVREFDQLAGLTRLEGLKARLGDLAAPWTDLAAARQWLADTDRLLALRTAIGQTLSNLRRELVPRSRDSLMREVHLHWVRVPRVRISGVTAGEDDAEDRFVPRTSLPSDGGVKGLLEAALRQRHEARTLSQVVQIEAEKDAPRLDARRFLAEALTGLLAKLDAFEATERVGVVMRLRCADLTLNHPQALVTWHRAAAAVAGADGVSASVLYRDQPIHLRPQAGLVPIGMNPSTRLWEFYDLRSACAPGADPSGLRIPSHDSDGNIAVGEDTGIVFVLLPGGTFTMGAQREDKDGPNHDPGASGEEGQPHRVVLAPFFLARHELTQAQWSRLVSDRDASAGLHLHRVGGAFPVASVDWPTCDSLLHSHGFALPTEAQWEYGARAGTTTPWWTGADAELARAECRGLRAVGSTCANAFGLCDVIGGVSEWCADWSWDYFDPCRAGDGLRQAGSAWSSSRMRVYRGGSFAGSVQLARSAHRGAENPSYRAFSLGVRPARALQR